MLFNFFHTASDKMGRHIIDVIVHFICYIICLTLFYFCNLNQTVQHMKGGEE